MPIILAIQVAEIRRIEVQSQPQAIVCKTLSRKKPITKKGLMEWLKQEDCLLSKCEALSSNPSTTKKKERGKKRRQGPTLVEPYYVLSALLASP
jgi:hypothetical protein